MKVAEIFKSIQGESTRVGIPMTFVRLAGCQLTCRYCDTPQARDAEAGREMSVEKILSELFPLPFVEITGGEPLLQRDDVVLLADELIAAGNTVLLETSGTEPIAGLDEDIIKIVDVKCPGSGMSDRVCWDNLKHLGPRDEVKFVLTDRQDYDWAKDVVEEHGLLAKPNPVLFSPASGFLEPAELAAWILADDLPVRLQIQLHKILRLP
ncbi:MAG: 7-carboxy-7-deazaguanine synthase QueE [Planctomycetia bacterium]|nr:7-carboxy-7-deazaguanine synthase QueE [Planctomycetia bacterium]